MKLRQCIQISIVLLSAQLGFIDAFAQKLANKQVVSVHPPASVKIDGNATEWGDKLQAYNKATQLFYTLANDDKKLYLVIQSKNQRDMTKIIKGITLIVQKTGKRSEQGAAIIKFPYFYDQNIFFFFPLTQTFEDGWHKDPNGKIAVSVIKDANKRLKSLVKWIYTKGVLGKDSVISVYNKLGIEARNGFSIDKVYTSELAIDLNLLGLSTDKASKFSYHILVNGEPNKWMPHSYSDVKISFGEGVTQAQADAKLERLRAADAAQAATTDFWGEYTLAN